MSNENHTPINKLPVVIDSECVYIMRNGSRVLINTVQHNEDKTTTSFKCKGLVEREFRGKKSFKDYRIWHESGMAGAFESEFDIISKNN
jgi:hypothetical protein